MKSALIFSLSLLATLCSGQGDGAKCPTEGFNPRYMAQYGDSCFYFDFYYKQSYADAESQCEEHGGTLASVLSAQVDAFLQATMVKLYNGRDVVDLDHEGLWVGLSDRGHRGNYTWESGDKLNYSIGIPPYLQTHDICIAITPQPGDWLQIPCHFSSGEDDPRRHFICQFKPEQAKPSPSPTQPASVEDPQAIGRRAEQRGV